MNSRLFFSLVVLLMASLSCQFLSSAVKISAEAELTTPTSLPATPVEEIPVTGGSDQVAEPTLTAPTEAEAAQEPAAAEAVAQEEPTQQEATPELVANDKATQRADEEGTLSAKKYLERADEYLDAQAYQEAIDDFSHAIGLDKKSQSAFWHRGIAYYSLGEYDKALDDMDVAVKLWPGQPNPIYWRGLIYFQMGEYEKAIAEYDLALEKTKAAHWTNSDWGYISTARQEAEDALNK